jgi:hypothetical protein
MAAPRGGGLRKTGGGEGGVMCEIGWGWQYTLHPCLKKSLLCIVSDQTSEAENLK